MMTKRIAIYGALAATAVLVGWLAGSARIDSSPVHYGSNVITLNDSNFVRHVLGSTRPVLVDFWSPTCVPCRNVAPVISALADEYLERVVVGTVNVDEETRLAEKYNVEGIPAFFIFKDGKPFLNVIGPLEKKEFEELLNKVLAGTLSAETATPSAATSAPAATQ